VVPWALALAPIPALALATTDAVSGIGDRCGGGDASHVICELHEVVHGHLQRADALRHLHYHGMQALCRGRATLPTPWVQLQQGH